MEQKHLLLIVFGSLCFSSFSQQNTVASGENASGTGGSVSYTVGQIDYIHASGTGGSVNQGVQQVYEIEDVSGINELSSLITTVFPNPTNGIIGLEIKNAAMEMSYELIDLSGRTIESKPISAVQTTIDLNPYANGEYLLNISSRNQLIKTLKIVKHSL